MSQLDRQGQCLEKPRFHLAFAGRDSSACPSDSLAPCPGERHALKFVIAASDPHRVNDRVINAADSRSAYELARLARDTPAALREELSR